MSADQPKKRRLLGVKEAAHYVGLSKSTLDKWRGEKYRAKGIGPSFYRLGLKRVAYDPAALDEWLATQLIAGPASPTRLDE